MEGPRPHKAGPSHHHHQGGTRTLPLQQHDVVGMPEAAAAPNWSSAGDRSLGAQASFICAQYHHNANTLEVWVKLQIFFKKSIILFLKRHLRQVPSIVVPVCCWELHAEILTAQARARDTAQAGPVGALQVSLRRLVRSSSGLEASKTGHTDEQDSTRAPQWVS